MAGIMDVCFPEIPSCSDSGSGSGSDSDSDSRSSSPLPTLDPSTLALLDDFLSIKADEERRYVQLLEEQNSARLGGVELSDDEGEEDRDDSQEERGEKGETVRLMMGVDEYRLAFGEDWQLSQFWYTTPFADRLAALLHGLLPPESESTNPPIIAFVCTPTAYVAFQHRYRHAGARLLEVDQRFAVLDQKRYEKYDLDEPEVIPEYLRERVDVALVDPPFLNRITNEKLATSLSHLLHPTRGKLVLITSTQVEDDLMEVYAKPPLGPLRKTRVEVLHGRLQNDFACWGSWEGAEGWSGEEEEGK